MLWNSTEYTGWGRALKAKADLARPERVSTLKALWKDAKHPAIGKLRSYGDAALVNKGRAIDMTRMNRLIAFDPKTGILEAEAGITIGEIARVFGPQGFLPAVMPGTGFATLGGCIANDVHGKNHHVDGTFGQHVVSVALLGLNGRVRQVSPDKTPDLFKATLAGLGQTGVILSAKIQMIEIGSEVVDVRENRMENLDEFLARLDSSNARFSVGWIDALAQGAALGRGILEEAEIREHATPLSPRPAKSVPINGPSFLMSAPIVRAFNATYIRRVPEEGVQHDRTLDDFFFPLDRVQNWNRLYGKKGFHQFQCVLPADNAARPLREMLSLIAEGKLASPLAVLKRLGPGRAGYLSFPMEGYTLAVDFPNRPRVAALVDRLVEITLNAGGRIYFAKDSLAKGDAVKGMYPERGAFAEIANTADPEHLLTTDLVKRLKLRRPRP